MSVSVCGRVELPERKGVKIILELILTGLAIMLGETLIFIAFEKRMKVRWGDGDKRVDTPQPTSEGSFWQNIISYDHKKGGEKD